MFTWIKDRLSERTSMDGYNNSSCTHSVISVTICKDSFHTLVSHMGYGVFGNLNND